MCVCEGGVADGEAVPVFQQRNLRSRERQKLVQQQQLQVLSKSAKGRERERMQQVRKWQKQMRQKFDNKGGQVPVKHREASVAVRPSWKVLEEMDFPRLFKLSLPAVGEGHDVYRCGAVEFYDKAYNLVTCKNERPLQRINRIFHKVTTTDDPIIRQLEVFVSVGEALKGYLGWNQHAASAHIVEGNVRGWQFVIVSLRGGFVRFEGADEDEGAVGAML
ncbi:hypothetical protein HPB52_021196 [Rhipicephalus sanguineus]|uniref:Eukaryotic translation initiation factor 3 subunit p66 n=1 Tax=Rhipicephalus sanguineus TaxID=34632 RepID=A0A9D4SRZ6_RHISA|nr:hypothetical protein HPB52_021196 [Rhipicephalus sanguineus]